MKPTPPPNVEIGKPVNWRALLPDARDLHVYGGAVLVGTGASFVYRPAGLVVVGAFLLYLGLFRMARR